MINKHDLREHIETKNKKTAKLPLRRKKVLICGSDGSGKTHLFKEQVVKQKLRFLVWIYDLNDFKDTSTDNFIILNHTRLKNPLKEITKEQEKKEFDEFIKYGLRLASEGHIEGIFVDEFDYLLDHNESYPQSFNYLITQNRHAGFKEKGISVVCASKRPNSTNTKYAESVQTHIIFGLSGENVKKKYNNFINGLGDLIVGNLKKNVKPIKYEQNNPQNEFIVYEVGEMPVLYSSN